MEKELFIFRQLHGFNPSITNNIPLCDFNLYVDMLLKKLEEEQQEQEEGNSNKGNSPFGQLNNVGTAFDQLL